MPQATPTSPGHTPADGVKSAGPSAKSEKPADKLSEAEFLERQAEDAKAALAKVLSELKAGLAEGVNPVEWAREYPWISLGAAAVAGFVGTAMLVPSREQQALSKLAAIERAINPPRPDARAADDGHDKPGGGNSRSVLLTVFREVLSVVRPVLISAVTAGIAGKQAKPSEAEMEAAAAHENVKESTGQAPG